MKVIRLLYPDYQSGGLDTYYFGAKLLQYILPKNNNQELIEVKIDKPGSKEYFEKNGVYAREEILNNLKQANKLLEESNPDKIITIGGNCLVSQAPFDYLHGKYENLGIIWIDAHPDVSTPKDGYPYVHAMVLGNLLGCGDNEFASNMKNDKFKGDEILYIGLQDIHDYQENFLNVMNINYEIQNENFVSNENIQEFVNKFDHILVHFDIDVLNPTLFHSTYFANDELIGDGSGSGKMTIDKLSEILNLIFDNSDVVGFTIAEYLPFDEFKLHNVLNNLDIFKE